MAIISDSNNEYDSTFSFLLTSNLKSDGGDTFRILPTLILTGLSCLGSQKIFPKESMTFIRNLRSIKSIIIKKLFFIFLILALFLRTEFVQVACAVTRIMPLGDSITNGATGSTDDTGYRRSLYLQLTDACYDVDFVGSLSGGVPNDFDKDHEGHGGSHALGGTGGGIAPNVYNWLDTNPTDVILLHIGTNDVSGGDEDASEVEAILDNIDQWESDNSAYVTVITARIILRDDTLNPETIAFNDAVETMALGRIDIGDDIVIVDMENALTYPDHLADVVHPNDTGYGKMADIWFSALQQILPDPPTADFNADPLSGTAPLTVDFVDDSTGSVNSWSWDFGDGLGTSNEQNPTYTYDNAGTYTVSLTVSGPGGTDMESKTDYIVVNYLTPDANFTADATSGVAPLTVSFTDESTGDIAGWLWDFGDGETSIEQDPSHTYSNPGVYTVSLGVTGPGGADSQTATDYITVVDPEDFDGDGMPNEEEQGPTRNDPTYDGNDDGIPDSQQDNVASGYTHDDQYYVTMAVPAPLNLSNCGSWGNPHPVDTPSGVSFPYGFFEFTINGLGPGDATTLTLYLPIGANPTSYWKYGPTPSDPNPHWYQFKYDALTQTGAEINGSVITLHFVDGKRGDDVLIPEGVIIDQGGPSVQSTKERGRSSGGGGGGGGCLISTASSGLIWTK